MMKTGNADLLTMRQFLFLHWLYHRKMYGKPCTDAEKYGISCKDCLNKDKNCEIGVIPGSYFYKRIQRQYYDCKRVLNTLEKAQYIESIDFDGKNFKKFYILTILGKDYYENFCNHYDLNSCGSEA